MKTRLDSMKQPEALMLGKDSLQCVCYQTTLQALIVWLRQTTVHFGSSNVNFSVWSKTTKSWCA